MFKTQGFFQFSLRFYASPNRIKPFRKPKVFEQIEAQAISLKSKGFLRSQAAYEPPSNVHQQINDIAKDLNIVNLKNQKFEFLSKCADAFNGHSIPNSMLYEIKTIDDVVEFYLTPVDRRTPFEKLDKSVPNLHVISEPRRFNPETDGISAFPKSSTLITGIKNRKKYKTHIVKSSWP